MPKPVPPPRMSLGGVQTLAKWGYRSAGLSGGVIPLAGDFITAGAKWALNRRGYVQQAKWLGQGATASIGLGATIALDQYHQRWGLGNMGARGLENISFGMYKAPSAAWGSSPKSDWEKRGGRDALSITSEKVGRFGDGPPSLSRRTRRSPRVGKRRRCKHKNKAGKRCVRPAGHSGRHSYR